MSKTILADIYDIMGGATIFSTQADFFEIVVPLKVFQGSKSQINHYFTGRRKFSALSKYRKYVREEINHKDNSFFHLARIIYINDREKPVYQDLFDLIIGRMILSRDSIEDYQRLYLNAQNEISTTEVDYAQRAAFLGETMVICFTADSKTSNSNVYNVNDIVNASFWSHQDDFNDELAQDAAEYFAAILREGASGRMGNRAIINLARNENAFGCFDAATLEEYGDVAGYPRYNEAYRLYKAAHEKGLALATWCLGYMHYMSFYSNGRQDVDYKHDYNKAMQYFREAEDKGCAAAINSIGRAYYEGHADQDLSIEESCARAVAYFMRAKEQGYIYSYNNLGKIHEALAGKQKRELQVLKNEYASQERPGSIEAIEVNQKLQTLQAKINQNMKTAFDYYQEAADRGESWAANRVGWFYLEDQVFNVPRDLNKAFVYFSIAISVPDRYVCKRALYNIAVHFYRNGVKGICEKQPLKKVIDELEKAADGSDGVIEASFELLDIYEYLIRSSPDRQEAGHYYFLGSRHLQYIQQYLELNGYMSGRAENADNDKTGDFREKIALYEAFSQKWQNELKI